MGLGYWGPNLARNLDELEGAKLAGERPEVRAALLESAGNAYRGVGVPFCVRSGEAAAELISSRHIPCAVVR